MVAILHPTGPGPQIPIDRAVVLIGRSPECDVVLDFSSRISRVHCALVQVDSDYYIRDLGSLNGVFVGGQKVDKDVRLTNGHEVVVGDVEFLFLENVVPQNKPTRVGGLKGASVLIQQPEVAQVVEISDEVAMVDLGSDRRSTAAPPSPNRTSPPPQPQQVSGPRNPESNRAITDDVEVIDGVEILDEVEIVDAVDIVNEVQILDVVEEVEVLDDVEIVDVEIVDVEIVEDFSPMRRRRPRLR